MVGEYLILYHQQVVQNDIPKITKTWKVKIRKAIDAKLSSEPTLYGKPLRRSLASYYKLRVGDYRIVYKIHQQTVKILMIRHRSVIYSEATKRI